VEGAVFIVEWLAQKLIEHGQQVDTVWLPFADNPDTTLRQMLAYRMIDLAGRADKLVAFRPPAHVIRHPNKTLWLIHQFRGFYDLWDTSDRPVADDARGRAFRRRLIAADTRAIGEARNVFTNSRVVSARLKQFNNIDSQVLYPPIYCPERFRPGEYGDEIVCISRITEHKRQHLLIEAMRHVKSRVKLRLCGVSGSASYYRRLIKSIVAHSLRGSITLDHRWVAEEDKANIISQALAIAYVPFDEDSYGYPCLEAAHAEKAVITTVDSGGVLEFVQDRRSGMICDPEPEALASCFDALYNDRYTAKRLGIAARQRVDELQISWAPVVEKILA